VNRFDEVVFTAARIYGIRYMNMSSILLVEDHAGFANALRHMLAQNPNLQIAAVAESAEAALRYLRESKVDLVLVDYSLPDMSGVNLLEAILAEHPNLFCAMLSGHLSLQHARRALELGARGYLIKDNPLGILNGIPRILRGEIYISEELRSLGASDLLTDFT
jgi:DNA-binding NarL/FixJ family response regulator